MFIAVLSFITHLSVIAATNLGFFGEGPFDTLLTDPIAAIYTPFSFILVYEVYLLIYYLPASITQYIGKQYEIITLIVIRRIFKDIANLDLTANWFESKEDLQFTYDILTTLVLFGLLLLFYYLNSKRRLPELDGSDYALQRFIAFKKNLSVLLVPLFFGLAVFSLATWFNDAFLVTPEVEVPAQDLNNIFFDDFFTILIMTDVLLLLFSFIHTQSFPKVIRNSGFIISTVLLKLSFSTTGLLNSALIISAVAFGVCIMLLFIGYERLQQRSETPRREEKLAS